MKKAFLTGLMMISFGASAQIIAPIGSMGGNNPFVEPSLPGGGMNQQLNNPPPPPPVSAQPIVQAEQMVPQELIGARTTMDRLEAVYIDNRHVIFSVSSQGQPAAQSSSQVMDVPRGGKVYLGGKTLTLDIENGVALLKWGEGARATVVQTMIVGGLPISNAQPVVEQNYAVPKSGGIGPARMTSVGSSAGFGQISNAGGSPQTPQMSPMSGR